MLPLLKKLRNAQQSVFENYEVYPAEKSYLPESATIAILRRIEDIETKLKGCESLLHLRIRLERFKKHIEEEFVKLLVNNNNIR